MRLAHNCRIAMRTVGSEVVIYLAWPGTLADAMVLARLNRTVLLMSETLADEVKAAYGKWMQDVTGAMHMVVDELPPAPPADKETRAQMETKMETKQPTLEELAAAFNEWMRRELDDPDKTFRSQKACFQEFQKAAAAGEVPTFGSECVAYLFQLVAEARQGAEAA